MDIQTKSLHNGWIEYTLTNEQNIELSFLNYGGIITKFLTPDKNGELENIVLSYSDYKNYTANPHYFGAIIGQVAGRIKDAKIELDGITYSLEKNEQNNHLHGGTKGLHQALWQVEPFKTNKEVGAHLTYETTHLEAGYPGNITYTVTYRLTNENKFIIDYFAETDRKTVIALTNHSYFNLSGNLRSTILDHHLQIHAKKFLELNKKLIPTGKLIPVKNTPFDFQREHIIQENLHQKHAQTKLANNGLDHYFLFEEEQQKLTLTEQTSGRKLELETTHPGVVIYTANGLDNKQKLRERNSKPYLGICLETQEHPFSLHMEKLPSVIVTVEKPYQKQTIFSIKTT